MGAARKATPKQGGDVVGSLGRMVLVTTLVVACSKKPDDVTPQASAATPPMEAKATAPPPSPVPSEPEKPAELPDDPAQRPESRLPAPKQPCDDGDSRCPSCFDVQASIEEVPGRLKYLGIPFSLYTIGDTEDGLDSLSYTGTILVVDSKNEPFFKMLLNDDFERFYDAIAKVRKQRGLNAQTTRNEFNNLRLGLMGHIWCSGVADVDAPKRSTVSNRVAFAFVGRRMSFQRVAKLDNSYGWSWPPGFKPLGFSALGDHEQLLEKVYESGNSLTGGLGRGYAVLRKTPDEMLELRDKVADVLADVIVVPDLVCNNVTSEGKKLPCWVEGIEFPTLVLRDKKTKKAFLIQDGLTSDD